MTDENTYVDILSVRLLWIDRQAQECVLSQCWLSGLSSLAVALCLAPQWTRTETSSSLRASIPETKTDDQWTTNQVYSRRAAWAFEIPVPVVPYGTGYGANTCSQHSCFLFLWVVYENCSPFMSSWELLAVICYFCCCSCFFIGALFLHSL